MSKNFALTGVAGYVAPRHLAAIRDTGNRLLAAVDPHDSAGILDGYFGNVAFFTEFERFDRHLEKLRRGPEESRVRYLTVCSPNHLHDAHIRLALRVGADAICEKPLVLRPWNLDALTGLEEETGGRVYTVLQLRLHPSLIELKEKLEAKGTDGKHEVLLTYVTGRGPWYRYSWKGDVERSGGVATNIGIHLFDLLLWLFGGVEKCELHLGQPDRCGGYLELERARVSWFLSIRPEDLPFDAVPGGATTHRSIKVDGEEVEFTKGFTDLHTRVYEEVLAGRGFGIAEARPSVELVHRIRTSEPSPTRTDPHPFLTL